MSKSSSRIVNLLTQATQALEKGELQIRLPEVPESDAPAAMRNPAFRTALANGSGEADAVSDQEMRQVCQAFNGMADAICKRDRERLNFMAMAAHDLNNPLMVINGAARMLLHNDVPLDERQECLDRLMRNVVSLQYIVAELNDKVQAQAGQLRLNFAEVDLTELTRGVVDDFSASITSHPIHFESDGACFICGDSQRLRRLLLNLLSNAVKYSDAGREVTVSVWRRGADVFLTVQDRGVGVSSSDVERMFLPFTRLESSAGMADGSGIGLASAQKVVEAHGAEIRAQGAPRQGTTVEMRFKLVGGGAGEF
jgi:signal transduction histidine kinase